MRMRTKQKSSMENKNTKKIMVVYGSLKKGKYNHYLLGDAEYLGDKPLHGIMQLAGSYPHFFEPIVGDSRTARTYPAEVYRVSEEVFDDIAAMEIGAGYYDKKISTDWGIGTVWMTQPSLFSNKKPVVEEY